MPAQGFGALGAQDLKTFFKASGELKVKSFRVDGANRV